MAIVLFAVAGILLGGVISLVKQGATRFSVGVVAVLAVLAAAVPPWAWPSADMAAAPATAGGEPAQRVSMPSSSASAQ